jgi:MHS family proline/betaine transporter-like MFS transporter
VTAVPAPEASTSPIRAGATSGRRAVAAAVLGNLLEWYDFAVYGYLALVLAGRFFPKGDEVGALLATFAAFGVGFVVRPLGGILIGRMGTCADARPRSRSPSS